MHRRQLLIAGGSLMALSACASGGVALPAGAKKDFPCQQATERLGVAAKPATAG